MSDNIFDTSWEMYVQNPTDENLALAIQYAPLGGAVILKNAAGEYVHIPALNGAYEPSDLLIPTRNSIEMEIKIGGQITPDWLSYDTEKRYFTFSEPDFCQAFIAYHHLRRHKGDFYAGDQPTTADNLRELILRCMAVIRKQPGNKVEGLFRSIKTRCKDDEPQEKRQQLTIEKLRDYMNERGYGMRYNVLLQRYEVIGTTDAGRQMTQDDLLVTLHSELSDGYKGTSFDALQQYIAFLGREDEYNPVLELLERTQWDQQSRIGQLFQIIGIEDDDLSRKLVQKWLMQTVALLFNKLENPFGADGVLVLNGEQGYGKTSLFRHLAIRPEWFGEGESVDDRDKDTRKRTITTWISELGEVENTLRKSDLDGLKGFITQGVDSYRLPYGKNDIVAPRRTSLCATCNNGRFLLDVTGNRRWWSVPLTRRITRYELESLDALQLWAEIYDMVAPLSYQDKAACFRLYGDDMQELSGRNQTFEKPLRGQDEVEDILEGAKEKGFIFQEMTVSEFKDKWSVLRPYTAEQIGAVLKKIGVNGHRTNKGRFYELPTPFREASPFAMEG